MGRLLARLRARFNPDDDDAEDDLEINDADAEGLSHVGSAVYEILKDKHSEHHDHLWNVTQGTLLALDQTPNNLFSTDADPEEGHSDWFSEKVASLVAKTEIWCDVMSLGPPDGKFMDDMRDAVTTVHRNADPENPPVIRMMFGNIIAMPVDCTAVVENLTRDIGPDPNVLLWVGAWRNGVSWNHAKIVAVDGKYLHTGGHNLWDKHYLRHSPVFDLSMELEGAVAHDGHLYANNAWKYVKHVQGRFIGRITENLPDYLPTVLKRRVTVSDFPEDEAGEFPPLYQRHMVGAFVSEDTAKMITVGRTGSGAHPADDAFVAMLDSAQTIIRLGLQDLGPVCIPGTSRPLPGCIWPHNYLEAFARAIWERGVDIEMVLSNPGSIPGGLSGTEACYGNGWSCVDVASEVIKAILKQYPEAEEQDDALRAKVTDNLRICYLKTGQGAAYDDGNTKGMHAKHFIVDDIACYVGSQNLYVCDLSEWGVIVDDPEKTARIKEEYWDPMWEFSHTDDDVDVDAVMDGLGVDRDGADPDSLTPEEKAQAALALTQSSSAYCKDHDSDSED